MNTDTFLKKLSEEKKLLEVELADLGRYNKSTGEWEATPMEQLAPEADQNDLADRAENFEERTSTLAPLESRLGDIKAALAKIADGTYGKCEICGMDIEEDRLMANPAARTCKMCMDKAL